MMNSELEAYEIIREYIDSCSCQSHKETARTSLKFIKRSLERNQPKTVKAYKFITSVCPSCDEQIEKWMDFCPSCGQRLNWNKNQQKGEQE